MIEIVDKTLYFTFLALKRCLSNEEDVRERVRVKGPKLNSILIENIQT